jgi:hypothetical protein
MIGNMQAKVSCATSNSKKYFSSTIFFWHSKKLETTHYLMQVHQHPDCARGPTTWNTLSILRLAYTYFNEKKLFNPVDKLTFAPKLISHV